MNLSRKQLQIIAIIGLYLFTLYFWTLPLHNNRLPFGDVDASSHFTIGDFMVSYDRSIAKIPEPIMARYGTQNSGLPGYLWYPPQYWTHTGIAQIFGGERIFPPFLIVAFFSSLIVLSSYFLIRPLFGFWPAFLSSFLLIFSVRDYMIYLWGQWPQSLSFAFTPIILYCFYQYYQSLKEGKAQWVYFPIMSVLLAGQFFFHPQGLIASVGTMALFCGFMLLKTKKLPFSFKHVIPAIILFVVLSVGLAPLNIQEFFVELAESDGGDAHAERSFQLGKLFQWYQGITGDPGLPDFYFTYNGTHGSPEGGLLTWWTLPILFMGLIFLLLRRKDSDILLLSWFITFYILTRLVVIGMGSRDIRMFAFEAHVFYPIIALGLLFLPSFLPTKKMQSLGKYVLIGIFLFFTITINAQFAYATLSGQQFSAGRINPMQYEAAEWVKDNLPEDADIYAVGTLGYQFYGAKVKWLLVLSQRHFITADFEQPDVDYIFVDYSDGKLLRNQDYINSISAFESQFSNLTPLYNRNDIRIYEVSLS